MHRTQTHDFDEGEKNYGGYININTSNTFITGSLLYDWFGSPRKHLWSHGVMVSTLDFESSDPSSNLGGT